MYVCVCVCVYWLMLNPLLMDKGEGAGVELGPYKEYKVDWDHLLLFPIKFGLSRLLDAQVSSAIYVKPSHPPPLNMAPAPKPPQETQINSKHK